MAWHGTSTIGCNASTYTGANRTLAKVLSVIDDLLSRG